MNNFFCTLLFFSICTLQAFAKKPNVLVFLVDDMGVMDTSLPFLTDDQGQPKKYSQNQYFKTPAMEKLAARGIRFETFYANSTCSPSRASLMTGQSSARHKTTHFIYPTQANPGPDGWNWEGLKKSDVTLARSLQQAGYYTIHSGKAHWGGKGTDGANPLNLGFDVNIAGSEIGHPESYFAKNNFGHGIRHVPGLDKYHGTETHLTDAITTEMCAAIDVATKKGKPFFAHLSHFAVHGPFQPDPRFIKNYPPSKSKEPAFASLVEGMDKSLQDIMNHLEKIGQAENTMIFFLGDNGSASPKKNCCAPLRHKKGSKYEGGTRVPFIAAWVKPDKNNALQKKFPIAQGVIKKSSFATIEDLMPTILSLTETPTPANHVFDGVNFLPSLAQADAATGRNHFLLHFPHGHASVNYTAYREGQWKVIKNYTNNEIELYDLKNDISEANNLAKAKPEIAERMLKAMQKRLDDAGALYITNEELRKKNKAFAQIRKADRANDAKLKKQRENKK